MKRLKVKYYLVDYVMEGLEMCMKVRYKKDVVRIASDLSKKYYRCFVTRVIENEEGEEEIDTNFKEKYIEGYGWKIKW